MERSRIPAFVARVGSAGLGFDKCAKNKGRLNIISKASLIWKVYGLFYLSQTTFFILFAIPAQTGIIAAKFNQGYGLMTDFGILRNRARLSCEIAVKLAQYV